VGKAEWRHLNGAFSPQIHGPWNGVRPAWREPIEGICQVLPNCTWRTPTCVGTRSGASFTSALLNYVHTFMCRPARRGLRLGAAGSTNGSPASCLIRHDRLGTNEFPTTHELPALLLAYAERASPSPCTGLKAEA